MSQSDIYKFLKKNKNKWQTTKEIGKGMSSTANYVGIKIAKMLDFFPELECKRIYVNGYNKRLWKIIK